MTNTKPALPLTSTTMPTSSSSSSSLSSSMIVAPRLAACQRGQQKENPIQCSLHTLPKPLLREFHHVFADKHLDFQTDEEEENGNNNNNNDHTTTVLSSATTTPELLAIPTNQHARHDLVAVGEAIEEEKDRLLQCFMDFGQEICSCIRNLGYWADYIDPCSGLPMLTSNCNKVYSEVDGMEILLNYKAYNAGFCKVLQHPTWGSAVYPATMFCYAPRQVVVEILQSMYITS